jgi:hypothetical protein
MFESKLREWFGEYMVAFTPINITDVSTLYLVESETRFTLARVVKLNESTCDMSIDLDTPKINLKGINGLSALIIKAISISSRQ